ncbi:hypothetical protein JW824_00525 [bacterium]|nr:hypothetical protein [bacterium]RQV99132.1 MAG: hypothetical protein EH221_00690 [bacterium]
MKNRYTLLLEKYRRFNDWEIRYNKQISVQEHLEQFAELYEFGQSMHPDMIQKWHQEHLEALIQTQGRLRAAMHSHQSGKT